MKFEINEKVKYLNMMLCEIDKIYQSLLSSKNLSDSEYVVLFAIIELGEGCLQKEIAQNTYISKKTVNATIKKLEKNGIIIMKAGKYPNMHIYLTPFGKKFMKENIIPIIDIENKVMENMSDKEFADLIQTYSKYISIFKEKIKKNNKE